MYEEHGVSDRVARRCLGQIALPTLLSRRRPPAMSMVTPVMAWAAISLSNQLTSARVGRTGSPRSTANQPYPQMTGRRDSA